MMNKLKLWVESLPEPIGHLATKVPFALRLGPRYLTARRAIEKISALRQSDYEKWVFRKLAALVDHAYDTTVLYKEKLDAVNYIPGGLRSLDHFASLPIVTKNDMRQADGVSRTRAARRSFRVNTGGTSGSPLEFSLDEAAYAREWAHMHWIWQNCGYHPSHVKLTFRGRRAARGVLQFNPLHNEYWVNASAPMDAVVEAIDALIARVHVKWIHGYPSLVAEFCTALEEHGELTHARLRCMLRGVLLGSENPVPVYRERIERVLSRNCVSWYGHSEMAILAWESSQGCYEPMPSYGYCEVVADDDSPSHGRLIVTSLYNRVHPFIRYDTGDRVKIVDDRRGRPSFSIVEGRIGDFVIDRDGRRHSLTAIIFGRHHQGFALVEHVQVEQGIPGKATLIVVPRDSFVQIEQIEQGFDLADIPMDWSFRVAREPIRSHLGKIRLKV